MPRYFFDIHNGIPQFDDTGIELSDPTEIPAAAKRLLPDIARDEPPTNGNRRTYTVIVTDENHRPIYSAVLTYTGFWLRHDAARQERGVC
jgi:hypothetical protein